MNDNVNKFKDFLVDGFQGLKPRDDVPGEIPEQEPAQTQVQVPVEEPILEETVDETPDPPAENPLASIESELMRIRYMLEDMKAQPAAAEMPDMSAYLTTREQSKAMNATVSKLEASSSNKTLLRAMEQISAMREDFFKLCEGMRARIAELDAETVLSSFEAYQVDMENVLTDANVYIGPFEFDRLNTLHQRIVGIVPTGDKEKDGTIAERLSDGYKLGDKVLLKERVSVYKFDQNMESEGEPEVETGFQTDSETPSQTDSETSCTTAAEEPVEDGTENGMEEKE